MPAESNENYNISTWAENNLSAEELQQFKIDEQENMQHYYDLVRQGLLVEQPIYEHKFSTILNSTIAIQTSVQVIKDSSIADLDNNFTPAFNDWWTRFELEKNQA